MNWRKLFIICFFVATISFLLTSCNKEHEKSYPSEIIIGDHTPTTSLAPHLTLNFPSQDTITLDLNNDGTLDLLFGIVPIPFPTGYSSAYFVSPKENVKIIL
jgi:hypothetical protein